jgi:DNA-binding MarR family transcriptional regulator
LTKPVRKRASEEAVLNLERYVPALITILANRLTMSGSTVYRQLLGVGATEMRVIVIVAAQPNISGIRIGKITGLDKAAVSRALKSLESLGLIKVTADTSHVRRQSISLTRLGRLLHTDGMVISLERERRLLKGFGRQQHSELIRLLNLMIANLGEVAALATETDSSMRSKYFPETKTAK